MSDTKLSEKSPFCGWLSTNFYTASEDLNDNNFTLTNLSPIISIPSKQAEACNDKPTKVGTLGRTWATIFIIPIAFFHKRLLLKKKIYKF
jgi:hypothetical protein